MSQSLDAHATLPPLRQDLQIMPGIQQVYGTKSWVIFDPLRHRYYQIDEITVQILSHWSLGTISAICSTLDDVHAAQIEQLVQFLYANALTLEPLQGDIKHYLAQSKVAQRSLFSSLLHNYLFIRIPLIRPHAFLKRSLALTDPFFSRPWWLFIGLLGLLGLYLTSRQWDDFVHTFLHFFSLQGLSLYLLSLVFIKAAHELGHAYATTRYGGRVPTMGIAFLVMFPVLYTDTTDSWKIIPRRERLLIDAAGVAVELMLAVVATFLWAFLPDGPWRSAAFFVATTSWIMSVAVNLNPLMRFDGYHFLSDLINVQNLQTRAFALGRWALRETLFGLQAPVPEPMTSSRRWGLVLFAWATWIYRFLLFLGIALLVYHFFFKALGVFLFLVEIGWFILLPIYSEISAWWKQRQHIMSTQRSLWTVSILFTLLALSLLPIQSEIRIPAILEAERHTTLFSPQAARIEQIHIQPGEQVDAGDPIFTLASPALANETAQTRLRIELLNARLARMVVDSEDLGQRQVLKRELTRAIKHLAGLEAQSAQLKITAAFSGRIVDLDPTLHPGRWVNAKLPLAGLISTSTAQVRGYVSAEDVTRIQQGTETLFIPDTLEQPKLQGTLALISAANAETLSIAALSSHYGGAVAVAETNPQQPLAAWYTITVALTDVRPPPQIMRGELQVQGKPESLASKIWRRAMRVLMRETSL